MWAGIAAAHYDYFRYGDLLFSVIETNVGADKLREFKRGYYQILEPFSQQLADVLHIAPERVEAFTNTIHFHGVGLAGSCLNNPVVKQVVAELGVTPTPHRLPSRNARLRSHDAGLVPGTSGEIAGFSPFAANNNSNFKQPWLRGEIHATSSTQKTNLRDQLKPPSHPSGYPLASPSSQGCEVRCQPPQ